MRLKKYALSVAGRQTASVEVCFRSSIEMRRSGAVNVTASNCGFIYRNTSRQIRPIHQDSLFLAGTVIGDELAFLFSLSRRPQASSTGLDSEALGPRSSALGGQLTVSYMTGNRCSKPICALRAQVFQEIHR